MLEFYCIVHYAGQRLHYTLSPKAKAGWINGAMLQYNPTPSATPTVISLHRDFKLVLIPAAFNVK